MGTQTLERVELNKKAFEICAQNRGLFGSKYLGAPEMTKYQKDLYEILFNNSRVCIKSAHDLGKTFTFSSAAIEAFVVDGALAGGAYIIVTAPTWNLIKNVFFSEVRKKIKSSKVPFGININQTEVKLDEKWQIIGFSPRLAAEGDTSTFQGFHAPLVIIIFEEATGISKQVYDMAEGMMTSANVKWWAIGNPTDGNCEFAKLFTKFDWVKVSWDCFLSPNLVANNIKDIKDIRTEAAAVAGLSDADKIKRLSTYKVVAPQLLTLRWVIEKFLDWGEESPLFQSKILANFPEYSEDTLFSIKRMEEIMDAFGETEKLVCKTKALNIEHLGVDVARFGNDNTVIFGLIGNVENRKEVYSKKDTTFITGRLIVICNENKAKGFRTVVTVDEGGIGGGVIDQLRNNHELMKNTFVEIKAVNFGVTACKEEKYANTASEMYVMASEQAKSTDGFILKKDDLFLSELTSRKYRHDTQGRWIIEPKPDFKKRIGHSPDIADAFVLAWYGAQVLGVGSWVGMVSNASVPDTMASAMLKANGIIHEGNDDPFDNNGNNFNNNPWED